MSTQTRIRFALFLGGPFLLSFCVRRLDYSEHITHMFPLNASTLTPHQCTILMFPGARAPVGRLFFSGRTVRVTAQCSRWAGFVTIRPSSVATSSQLHHFRPRIVARDLLVIVRIRTAAGALGRIAVRAGRGQARGRGICGPA